MMNFPLLLFYFCVCSAFELFPATSRVEVPCDDRRAYRCAFVHCDLPGLSNASSIIIPQLPFQNKVFARKMQWTVKGQFLTEFEVSSCVPTNLVD